VFKDRIQGLHQSNVSLLTSLTDIKLYVSTPITIIRQKYLTVPYKTFKWNLSKQVTTHFHHSVLQKNLVPQ